MAQDRRYVEAGGLLCYGVNLDAVHRRAAFFADKILKGANPADLPVEQPIDFDLVINLKTAKALGLTVPQSIVGTGDLCEYLAFAIIVTMSVTREFVCRA